MQVHASYKQGVEFEISAGEHKIVCDQPATSGGAGKGMTPPELLLASLASCAGYYVAEYLRSRNLPIEGLAVHVAAEKARPPARLSSFRIEIEAPVADEHHRDGMMRAAKKCLIHNTLMNPPSIEIAMVPSAHAGSGAEGVGVGSRVDGGQPDGARSLRGDLPSEDLPVRPADVRAA
jgi:uncharacterized OsmC-like protein